VSMIILNLVLGAALVLGGLRHKEMTPNHNGVSAYLAMLMALGTVAFALPAVIGVDGSYTTVQAVPVIVLTIGSYVFFLWRQMGAQAADFQEPGVAEDIEAGHGKPPITEVIAEHRAELLGRTGLLLLMAVPIVLLSHTMAELLDVGLSQLGAPVALTGIIIAAIVFLPETITTLRASWLGEIQRVSNLTQGALVSSVGLTVPTVLIIGLLTGQTVVFAESPANLMLLAATALLSVSVASGRRVGAIHGVAHLMLFAMYVLSVFV
jgi:Ca2+:H+ antiporter